MIMTELRVRLERLQPMRTACTHAFSDTPEEDAWKKIEEWAKPKRLLQKAVRTRIFGRNTYPTDNPEPHGYEFYLTVSPDTEPERDIKISEMPSGLYAVLRFEDLGKIREAWEQLWNWTKENGYEHMGWKKGEHGWYNGFEEHLNWYEKKAPNEWVFDLWVQLKE